MPSTKNLKIKHLDKFRDALGGNFTVKVRTKEGDLVTQGNTDNIITDVGIAQLGDVLAAIETTDIDLGFIEPGDSDQDPAVGDTDIISPITPADRLPATAQTRAASSPFEVEISVFINSTKYDRPFTIKEIGIFFTPDETGTLFARGELDTPITVTGTNTVTITYAIVFR